jgi:pimeloyl-ACP methyl ester carboxylesterase
MLALPLGYRGIAPDLRGYGDSEDKLVDATRGCMDWADDLLRLMDTLGVIRFHVAGHSLGGSVVWALLASAPQRLLSVTLAAPGSPFGFGGTRGVNGEACAPDFAGSGGGTVNPEFVRLLGEGYRGADVPNASPRLVMNSFYWKPPFVPAREEALLSSMLSEKTGPQKYPGDMTPSSNWPMVAPGVWGPINALSPKYVGDTVPRVIGAPVKPPVLWVRGADDQIVSDTSLFDLNFLGQLGAVPGWPGAETHPPQPMVAQTRAVLEAYRQNGGTYSEVVLNDCGHTPYIERPEAFNQAFHKIIA